jgi:hypothetical protein
MRFTGAVFVFLLRYEPGIQEISLILWFDLISPPLLPLDFFMNNR